MIRMSKTDLCNESPGCPTLKQLTKFFTNFLIPAMLTYTVDLYKLISLLLALTLTEGHKDSGKHILLGLISRIPRN